MTKRKDNCTFRDLVDTTLNDLTANLIMREMDITFLLVRYYRRYTQLSMQSSFWKVYLKPNRKKKILRQIQTTGLQKSRQLAFKNVKVLKELKDWGAGREGKCSKVRMKSDLTTKFSKCFIISWFFLKHRYEEQYWVFKMWI